MVVTINYNEKPIRFVANIPPGGEVTEEWTAKEDGEVSHFYYKFYGSMFKLEVQPMIEKLGTEIAVPLLGYADGGNGVMVGDNEQIDEVLKISLRKGDKLIVKGKNNHSSEYNTMNCRITVKELR